MAPVHQLWRDMKKVWGIYTQLFTTHLKLFPRKDSYKHFNHSVFLWRLSVLLDAITPTGYSATMVMLRATVPAGRVCTQEDAVGQHLNSQGTKGAREEPTLQFSSKETALSGPVSQHPTFVMGGQRSKTSDPRLGCHQRPCQSLISKLHGKHNSSDSMTQLESSRWPRVVGRDLLLQHTWQSILRAPISQTI